jgi:hypothetical protein
MALQLQGPMLYYRHLVPLTVVQVAVAVPAAGAWLLVMLSCIIIESACTAQPLYCRRAAIAAVSISVP